MAKELKAELRKRILPGLKIAEVTQREDKRRTHRAPELSVMLKAENEGPQIMTQTLHSLGVKTLEEIKKERPLLSLPKERSDRFASEILSSAASASMLSGFGRTKPISQWSREETEGYNSFVRSYYSKYAEFLAEQADFDRLVLRSLKVSLTLENTGTLTATDIDVDVTFPAGIILYGEDDSFAAPPTPPEQPPLRPMKPGVAYVTSAGPEIAHFDPARYRPRSTHVHPEDSRVRFSLAELKHNDSALFDPFFISFATWEGVESFDAVYVITAREPIDPIRGSIHFNVERDDRLGRLAGFGEQTDVQTLDGNS